MAGDGGVNRLLALAAKRQHHVLEETVNLRLSSPISFFDERGLAAD